MEFSDRHPSAAFFGRFSRRTLIILAVIVVLLVIGRILLPGFLKKQINERLAAIPGYTGHVDGVGVQLWHGGYSMEKLVIEKKSGKQLEPFVAIDDIHFSLFYRDLLHGQVVSEVTLDGAVLNFVRSASPEESQDLGKATKGTGHAPTPDKRWQDVVNDLFPLDISHLEISNSRIHYIDTVNRPRVDLAVDNLQVVMTGLRNRPDPKADPKSGAFPAQINASGDTIGRGKLALFIALEPLADKPHFQLEGSLENVSLPALNEFLLAYIGVDVSQGNLSLYTEINANDGSYTGYVKPLLTNLNFSTKTDEQRTVFQKLWKTMVAAATKVLRDKDQKQVATLIPFSGKFSSSTDIQIWTTLGNLFRNGFIEAIRRGLEGNAGILGEKAQGLPAPGLETSSPSSGPAAPPSGSAPSG